MELDLSETIQSEDLENPSNPITLSMTLTRNDNAALIILNAVSIDVDISGPMMTDAGIYNMNNIIFDSYRKLCNAFVYIFNLFEIVCSDDDIILGSSTFTFGPCDPCSTSGSFSLIETTQVIVKRDDNVELDQIFTIAFDSDSLSHSGIILGNPVEFTIEDSGMLSIIISNRHMSHVNKELAN